MKDVKNYFKSKICIFCKNNKREECLKIRKITSNNLTTYKCLNYEKNIRSKNG